MGMIGNQPANNFLAVTKDTFNGNASSYTLSKAATTNGVAVYVENVRQIPTTAYSVSGTTLTFTGTTPAGTGNVYVLHHNTPASTATHPAAQALTATSGTFTGAFTSKGIDDNADATAITITSAEAVGIGTSLTPNNYSGYQVLTLGGSNATTGSALDLEDSDGNIEGYMSGTAGRLYIDADPYNGNATSWIHLGVDGNQVLKLDASRNATITNGNLVIGTSGKGIDFSATANTSASNASMSSELLDFYEEGSWTPANSGSNITYSTALGHYTRVGRLVTASFQITVASNSSGDGLHIINMPFQLVGANQYGGGFIHYENTSYTQLHIYGHDATFVTALDGSSTLTGANLSGLQMLGMLVYFTS